MSTSAAVATVDTTIDESATVDQATALDSHIDTQVAMLHGVLNAMRQPKSSDAFKVLKSRFSDRSMAVQVEALKEA